MVRNSYFSVFIYFLSRILVSGFPIYPEESDGRPQQPPGETLPLKAERTLRIHAKTGTQMSLDISKDGDTLIFDMLGDLYTMPIYGGPAKQITRGLAFDTQATYSPDGKLIAFVSDRSGADNLWISDLTGDNARQLSFGSDDTVLVSPAWSADGTSVYISRYLADYNNVQLWRYGLDGVYELLVPIVPNRGASRDVWQSSIGAAVSPDGVWIYYAKRIGGLDYDRLNSWGIVRRHVQTGDETLIVGNPSDQGKQEIAFRPAISPYGQLLAYQVHSNGETVLRIRNLATGGEDREVYNKPLDRDQLQASFWQDIAARYCFTPDGHSIVFSRDGGFEIVDLRNGIINRHGIDADMRVDVGPSTRQNIIEESRSVQAHLIQAPMLSPDGRYIAYMAMGRIYVQSTRHGSVTPHFSVDGPDSLSQPAWSPDGKEVVYVSWNEKFGGAVWVTPVDGSTSPRRISDRNAFYTAPSFLPDGQAIAVFRSPTLNRQQDIFEFPKVRASELVLLSLNDHVSSRFIAQGDIGGLPQFLKHSPSSIVVNENGGIALVDMSSGAVDSMVKVVGPGWYFIPGTIQPVDDLRISPDGKWLLASAAQQLFLIEMPRDTKLIDLTDSTILKRRVTRSGVDYFGWQDSTKIYWSMGHKLYLKCLLDVLPLATGEPVMPDQDPKPREMQVFLPRAIPNKALLLRGGKVLTMNHDNQIIHDADILLQRDRISKVGARGSFPVPHGTRVLNTSGQTIIPGLIDEHDHIAEIRREVLSRDNWGLKVRLAYGVTTSFDPSTLSVDMLSYQDMLDAGLMTGPRLRSTGMAIFSMNRFTSLEDTFAVLQRYKQTGLKNVKEYRTGNRRVRQWMAMSALKNDLQPTTEGALSMKLDITQILDGYSGNEHALTATPLGDDVLGLLESMRTSYSTTLMITNGGLPASDWFVAHRHPAHDEKIRHFYPSVAIEKKLTGRPQLSLHDYNFLDVARDADRVVQSGGLLGIGAHGEVPGIGFHWEMEAHVMGGMSPINVLHAATAGSAEAIGRLHDLGTIEPGKFADLVILNFDPLDNIRNTIHIDKVMRDGFLYDGFLNQLWPDNSQSEFDFFNTDTLYDIENQI